MMCAFQISSNQPRLVRALLRTCALLVVVLAFGFSGAPAQADMTRITVSTGPQIPTQHRVASGRADQTIRIVVADPVRPGIRRAPVAEPVIYVIEADDAVRAVR